MPAIFRYALMALLLMGLAAPFSQAQSVADQVRQQIFEAYRNDDPASWEAAIQRLRQAWRAAERPTNDLLLELAISEYGMIGLCQQRGSCDDIEARMDRVEGYLDQLAQQETYRGRALALQGGLVALRINEAPWRGITLASESIDLIRQGTNASPDQPEAWVEMGNYRANAPELFGGDEKAALRAYMRAVNLFERKPESQRNSWLYLHALASLGRTQVSLGHTQKALQTYQKALKVAPGFKLVESKLLPELSR